MVKWSYSFFFFFIFKDGVIAIPREFKEAAVLEAELSTQFLFHCSVDANDMR